MPIYLPRFYCPTLVAAVVTSASLLLGATYAHASGMSPNTSVILVDETTGETSINVTNTDKIPNLLVTSVYNLPGDDEDLILLTPAMARVEPGESQLVRFILQSDKPLTTERLRRVTFEGIQPKDGSSTAQVSVTLAQDLPIVISPKGLKKDLEPWKHLNWSTAEGQLVVNNPSPYVVRLLTEIELLPSAQKLSMPHTYVLPGQTVRLQIPKGISAQSVKIQPANLYGFAADDFTAPIK